MGQVMSGRQDSESDDFPRRQQPRRGEISLDARLERIEEWQCEHDEQDDTRHESIMKILNERSGQMQAANAIAVIIGLIGTVGGIYALFFK